MRQMATYDSLTGIPNRALFNDRLLNAMAMNKRHKSCTALLFIDLDGFKAVNDNYGHETGDQLLKQVSQRMNHCTRESDTVGRYGGDEFVVLLYEIHADSDATRIAKEIIQAISEQFVFNENIINIGCSIGMSIYRGGQLTANQFINQADEAMYKIKKTGKNNYKIAT
jgi:diguanylate cyclase (GGDEF)-like protein